MREIEYYTCDVFTDTRFGGNQLAVIPNATQLTSDEMQHIAKEFNYSETTFVLPSKNGHTKKVRIFTPIYEIPFAGHPNIGTAFILAKTGALGSIENEINITFEEKAGLVPIKIKKTADSYFCESEAPEQFSIGEEIPITLVAEALCINKNEISIINHCPITASAGFPFILVELKSVEALQKAKVNIDGFHKLPKGNLPQNIHVYTKGDEQADYKTRMFAPLHGIMEDAATGSANCALTGLLAHIDKNENGTYTYRISQGVEMGRPSILLGKAEKKNNKISAVKIGGQSILISKGVFYLD